MSTRSKASKSAGLWKSGSLATERFKIVSALGLVVGALWVWNQFSTEQPYTPSVTVAVDARPEVLGPEGSLLFVDVNLKNIGKVKAPVGGKYGDDSEGLLLTIIEYEDTALVPVQPQPMRQEGARHREGPRNVLDWMWELGDGKVGYVVEDYNMLSHYYSFPVKAGVLTGYTIDQFSLEPGEECHTRLVVPVRTGRLFGVGARIVMPTWFNGDWAYVRTAPAHIAPRE